MRVCSTASLRPALGPHYSKMVSRNNLDPEKCVCRDHHTRANLTPTNVTVTQDEVMTASTPHATTIAVDGDATALSENFAEGVVS